MSTHAIRRSRILNFPDLEELGGKGGGVKGGGGGGRGRGRKKDVLDSGSRGGFWRVPNTLRLDSLGEYVRLMSYGLDSLKGGHIYTGDYLGDDYRDIQSSDYSSCIFIG